MTDSGLVLFKRIWHAIPVHIHTRHHVSLPTDGPGCAVMEAFVEDKSALLEV